MMVMMIVTVLLMMTQSGQGFLITKAEPGVVVVSPGESVTLFCAVDDHYEWCKWFHPGGQFCDFEWKRNEDNITMQECALHGRVSFHGKYDDKECGITFTAQQQDTGLWKCEIEEYVRGWSRGAGTLQTAVLNVTVQTPTPPPSPPPTSPATPVTPTTQNATSMSSNEAASGKESSSTTLKSATQPNISKESIEEESIEEKSEKPDADSAEPQVEEIQDTKAGSSSSALISVVIVLVVIVILISGAVYYRRRQRSSPARAVYEKEAKTSDDKADMVRNSNSSITFHSGNSENSNLHEYFPPNLTYSTVTPESQA